MTKGEKIRQARLEKEMTLDELAEKCQTTKQTIHKYESGIITNIPSDKLELLCNALDLDPNYIMNWKKKDTDIWGLSYAQEAITRLGKYWGNLTESDIEEIEQIIKMKSERNKKHKVISVYNPKLGGSKYGK